MEKKYTPSEYAVMYGGHSIDDIQSATVELAKFDFIQSLGEARMFRSRNQISSEGSRNLTDHLFVSLLSLYAMSNDYNYAPVAKEYAKRTSQLGNFNMAKPSGTDLYQTIFSLQRPGEMFKGEKDEMLMSKVNIDTPRIKRFLQKIRTGQIQQGEAQQFFYKLERDLKIQDPKLRASRRLVSNWESLSTDQQKLAGGQLMRYYRLNARRSDLMPLFAKYANDNSLDITDTEKKTIGGRVLRTAGMFAIGYGLGKAFPTG